ncbi:MAG TPA: hypothetical protein VH165_16050 [Kofleriaceae bacterium]|jgi:hypothetical protein|nr:hypothetical protein [Kofleriaceae bacterium]
MASADAPGDDGVTVEGTDQVGDLINTSVTTHALVSGSNGSACTASPYNCKLRASGGSRVTTAGGDDSWGIALGASVRDGNGDVLLAETSTDPSPRLTFNYGQTRALAGKAHALALTTANASAGWYPLDHILGETSFRDQVGEVNAKDPGQGSMACYEVANTDDSTLELKKVVYDSQEPITGHERAGDYLPLVRANGRRSVNLIFSVPGFALGGATIDHFPAGARYQRVEVPTDAGPPSITIPLWVQDSAGRFRTQSGTMRFLYGYVRASDGTKRFGWMAQDALVVSSGCS